MGYQDNGSVPAECFWKPESHDAGDDGHDAAPYPYQTRNLALLKNTRGESPEKALRFNGDIIWGPEQKQNGYQK